MAAQRLECANGIELNTVYLLCTFVVVRVLETVYAGSVKKAALQGTGVLGVVYLRLLLKRS